MTYALIDNATLTAVQRATGAVAVKTSDTINGDLCALENFLQTPGLRKAWALLRHLEAQSTAGNTLVEVASVYGCGADVVGVNAVEVAGGGDVIGSVIAGSDDVLEAIRECEGHGWVVATEGHVQLKSNHILQSAVRHHLTRICTPFHPTYSEREIEHAFSRLSAFTPDMFAFDTDVSDDQSRRVRRVLMGCRIRTEPERSTGGRAPSGTGVHLRSRRR